MIRRSAMVASAVICVLALASCAAGETPEPTPEMTRPSLELSLGALLPSSGQGAQFGPATTAAVALAVADITEADVGLQVSVEYRDAGDSSSDTAITSVTELLDAGVTAIVGPLSDGVARKVVDQVIDAGVVQISPASDSPDFADFADDGLFWRTSPTCSLEGELLGSALAERGAASLVVLAQTESCGSLLAEAVGASFAQAGGSTVTLISLDGVTVASVVPQIAEADPDAVAVVSRTQAQDSVGALTGAGFTGGQLGFAGLAPGSYQADFAEGTLEQAVAVQAGPDPATLADFSERMLEIDPTLTNFSYAAQTYDAVILLALAALAADSTSGPDIAAHLQAVSGGVGDGEVADDFASAALLILTGQPVDYDGLSGAITFDERGEALGASIGLFEADDQNIFDRVN